MGAVSAQEQPSDHAGTARLTIALDARGAASVVLKVFERHVPSALAPVMSQVMGCEFRSAREGDADGDRIFRDQCPGAFLKKGLLVGGTIQFSPLIELLKKAKVKRLDVTIRHPRTGFARFTENGWKFESTPHTLEYTRSIPLDEPPATLRLAFGYRIVNFLPLTLLLFPVALSMLMRWAALRAKNAEPIIVWFTYWRVFGGVLTGTWLLWVQGSTVLDCAALARFLLNDSPKSTLLQVAFYLVPPILVQLICTVTSGAVLARVSGQQWVLPVTLKHAFWHEPVNIWPLLCLLAGVASLTLFNEFLLGFVCLAVAYASHVLLVGLWVRFQNFKRYELPEGDLRSRILELALKAGVTLQEIYLLPAAEGRLAGPFMTRAGRLFLSDYLLRSLRTREMDAVLAREMIHIKRRHRNLLLATTVLVLPLSYRVAHRPLLASRLPWAIRGPLLVWLSPVLLYLLWRRFERNADAGALTIVNDEAALRTGLARIRHLNLIGLYWRRLESRFFPNGTLRELPESLEQIPPAAEEALVGAAAAPDRKRPQVSKTI